MQTLPQRVRTVTSRQNSWIKDLRRAFAQGGALDSSTAAIESLHIVEEAVRSAVTVRALFFIPSQSTQAETLAAQISGSPELLRVSEDVFRSASGTAAPQGIAALIQIPEWALNDALRETNSLIICAAGLQDPGNLGTIARSAEAFGASGLLLLPGTVNLWNAKCVRASAGSAFRLPSCKIDASELNTLKDQGIRLLAAVAQKGTPLWESDLTGSCALFIGNEGAGIDAETMAHMDGAITIPQRGVESINAAVAASILCYEASRQRGHGRQVR